MNLSEYHLLANKPKKKPKFRNRRVELDGMMFDSMKERARWIKLTRMQQDNEINLLQRQVAFSIDINDFHICKYYADFTYRKNGELVVEDVKSIITRKEATYRLKKKLLKACLGIEIVEVM